MPIHHFSPLAGASQALFASSAVNVDLDPTVFAHFLLFTAFVVVMKDLIFDPLLKVFEERERRTAGAIASARVMDERAIRLKQDYDSKLEEIRREAAVDRERVRAKVKQLESELLEQARAAAHEQLEQGLAKIEAEARAIRKDLEAQRGRLAAEIAGRVLGRAVSPGGASTSEVAR